MQNKKDNNIAIYCTLHNEVEENNTLWGGDR